MKETDEEEPEPEPPLLTPYGPDQLYVILEYNYAGQDILDSSLTSAKQLMSVLLQVGRACEVFFWNVN